MKKVVMVGAIAISLAIPGRSSLMLDGWLEMCLDLPEQKAEQLREDLKDAANLRECMVELIGTRPQSGVEQKVEAFKRRFGVSDRAMQTALMDIVHKAGVKNGWKKRQGSEDTLDGVADWQIYSGLIWMCFCADAEGRKFLMGIATDSTVDREFRGHAVFPYLARSDDKEKMDVITRFFAGDMKGTVDLYYNSGLYHSAIRMHDKAESDPRTRESIVSMLSAALMEEKREHIFKTADKSLAERSREYAESPQRKAALERMNPPDKSRRNGP